VRNTGATAAGPDAWLSDAAAFTFDCYGTLVDWEHGVLEALGAVLTSHAARPEDGELLARFDTLERAATAGPYLPYREVLRRVVDGFARDTGFAPTTAERDCLVTTIGDWPPFADAVPALEALRGRGARVAILSNVDEDLFARTLGRLGVTPDLVVTAERVRSYKPRPPHFRAALEGLGVPPGSVVHVGASVHHDVEPARAHGMRTIHVARRSGDAGADAAGADLSITGLTPLIHRLAPDGTLSPRAQRAPTASRIQLGGRPC
jgi:2-haloacid dehalogenase